MTKNQLPEGVGKKIVEALKKQSEIEINPVVDADIEGIEELAAPTNNDLELFEDVISEEIKDNIVASEIQPEDNFIIEEPTQTAQGTFNFNPEQYTPSFINEPLHTEPHMEYNMPLNIERPKPVNMEKTNQVEVPANVAVLKRLISQLPSGVTKQTGAQIIRQTIEALGISMNTVLQEAQHVQDSLNSSIQDCMSKVHEYKTNIMNLERHAQDYQKQVSQLNDLISLFILTDKTK